MTALAPAETQRLIKLLGMLGSDHDGERAAAGLKAHTLIRERNLQWADLIQPRLASLSPNDSDRTYTPPREQHQGRALRLLQCGFEWNDWERKFLLSIVRWSGRLTPKQSARMDDLGAAAEAWLKSQGGACEF